MMRQSDARHRSKSRRHVSNRIAPECATNIEGLTWIRTKIDGVRVRCSTVELSPTRGKAKFGRTDVYEARKLEDA